MASPDKFYLTRETLKEVSSLNSPDYDGVLLITYPEDVKVKAPAQLVKKVEEALLLDSGLKTVIAVIQNEQVSGNRLVISPTGPISPYDDVRSLYEAAKNGVNRALKAGIKKPLLVLQDVPEFQDSDLVLLLGVLDALYVPLQVRDSGKSTKVDRLGVFGDNLKRDVSKVINIALSLDQARIVARDIAGGDPERMSPPNVETYIKKAFAGKNVTIDVINDLKVFEKDFPLLAAVNRAANEIEHHRGRIITITYTPSDPAQITDTVMLVGKGVTYDTGGVDVKYGGNMAGMSRDKSGAGAVAGFMKACQLLEPPHVKAIAVLGVVRNSIGENAYVADELIIARSGARIRVGNTDAEGRMIMADLLCLLKEQSTNEVNPHLYTVATLTGHSLRAVGIGYGIVIDNHAARKENHAKRLQAAGDRIADIFEISTLRRDDFIAHRGTFEGDDALQSGNGSSMATDRGHQKPAGFLVIASGMEGKDIKYSHLEIAPSAGIAPEEPTGSPMMALAHFYNIWKSA